MPGSSPYPSDGGPLLLPADGGLLAGRVLGRSRHHPQTRGVWMCLGFWGPFGGRLGVVDSCSDVSSMDGFTMLMFQFHAWVQGNLLGESYLFHPCSSYFIHWLVGTAQTEFRMPRRRYADILVPPFLPQMACSSFLGWADGVWGINMCRFRSNRTNHSVNYILHMNAFMTLSSKTSR